MLDELLPVEVRELPADLAVLDRLLADWRLLGPLEHAGEGAARGHGLPTIPIACFGRLMVIKQRTGWGCKTLVREVSDSLHLRRFCLLPLTVGCRMRGPACLHRLERGRLERIPSPLTLGATWGNTGRHSA